MTPRPRPLVHDPSCRQETPQPHPSRPVHHARQSPSATLPQHTDRLPPSSPYLLFRFERLVSSSLPTFRFRSSLERRKN
eukprot:3560644-Rhodomonas_salina.5